MTDKPDPEKMPEEPPQAQQAAPEEAGPQGEPRSGKKFDFNTVIFDLWHGKMDLLQTFWLYYFAVIVGLKVIGDYMGFIGSVFGVFELIWAGFMVKPIMLAADNYKGPQHWALAAKIGAVVIGLGVVVDAIGKIF